MNAKNSEQIIGTVEWIPSGYCSEEHSEVDLRLIPSVW